jgi:hypothetical protein
MAVEDDSMDLKPLESRHVFVRVPPSYEQCVAESLCPRADYLASPFAVAALADWDDEDDD